MSWLERLFGSTDAVLAARAGLRPEWARKPADGGDPDVQNDQVVVRIPRSVLKRTAG